MRDPTYVEVVFDGRIVDIAYAVIVVIIVANVVIVDHLCCYCCSVAAMGLRPMAPTKHISTR